MKKWMLVILAVCLFAIPVAAQDRAGEPQKQLDATAQLLAEVKKLRMELLQQSIEFQQWKLRQIERELQQAQSENDRLANQVGGVEQEVAALAAEPGKESESFREENLRQLQQLQSHQQPVRERIAALTAERNREETRLRQLSARTN